VGVICLYVPNENWHVYLVISEMVDWSLDFESTYPLDGSVESWNMHNFVILSFWTSWIKILSEYRKCVSC
jgi:hypothetical protein